MELKTCDRYLELFDGKKIFAAFPDREQGSAPPWHWHEEYSAELDKKFKERQSKGWGIFFTVNELDRDKDPERKRTKKMFKRARAIWIEDDEKYTSPRQEFPIPPNIILNSSIGKYHYYWLTSTEDADEWNSVQLRMVESYGSDPNAKDVARVLRMPGYDHLKKNPYLVTYAILHYKVYDWDEIKEHFPPIKEKKSVKKQKPEEQKFDEQQAIDEIISAKNFHGSFTSLALKYANITNNRGMIKSTLEGLAYKAIINGIPEDRRERLEAEINDLDRTIDTALDVVNEDDVILQSPIPKELVTDIDWPPGMMGELARSVYGYSPHPYKLVSIITGLALVAGVTGRKFNVNRTGLNLYITLLMPTGSGKNVIKQYINEILSQYPNLGTGINFIGPKRFTSPKAVIDSLKQNRSMVSIQTEAGLLFKSTAGDQQGILRTILDLYSCSGKNQVSDPEAYSSKDNSLPALHSPAMTIVNEATPATFIEEITKRNSIESGELARMSIFRYEVPKPYYNANSLSLELSDDLIKRITHLTAECLAIQNTDDYDVINIDYPFNLFSDFSRACVEEENRHMHEDSLKKAMVSRAPLKVLKIAAVLAALENVPYITEEQWNWSLSLYHYEMSLLSNLLDGGIDSDMDDVIHSTVMPAVVKILNNKYKDPKKQMPSILAGKGIFTFSALSQCIRNNGVIKAMNTNQKTGVQRIVEYMLYTSMIDKVNGVKNLPKGQSTVYKVTEEFARVWDSINR